MLLWTWRVLSFRINVVFFGCIPRSGTLLDHMVGLFLVCWGIFILSSTVAVPAYTHTSSVHGFPFLPILASIFGLLDDSHSESCEVVSCCGFHLNFSDFSDVDHLYELLWRSVVLITCTSFLGKYLFRSYAVLMWAVYVFWISAPCQSNRFQVVVFSFCRQLVHF